MSNSYQSTNGERIPFGQTVGNGSPSSMYTIPDLTNNGSVVLSPHPRPSRTAFRKRLKDVVMIRARRRHRRLRHHSTRGGETLGGFVSTSRIPRSVVVHHRSHEPAIPDVGDGIDLIDANEIAVAEQERQSGSINGQAHRDYHDDSCSDTLSNLTMDTELLVRDEESEPLEAEFHVQLKKAHRRSRKRLNFQHQSIFVKLYARSHSADDEDDNRGEQVVHEPGQSVEAIRRWHHRGTDRNLFRHAGISSILNQHDVESTVSASSTDLSTQPSSGQEQAEPTVHDDSFLPHMLATPVASLDGSEGVHDKTEAGVTPMPAGTGGDGSAISLDTSTAVPVFDDTSVWSCRFFKAEEDGDIVDFLQKRAESIDGLSFCTGADDEFSEI